MITPTIGRVVWYHPVDASGATPEQPYPALISYVHSDTLINVGGFTANGVPFAATSVSLVQDGASAVGGSWAEWIPYQKGQAAKTEALEAKAALLGAA